METSSRALLVRPLGREQLDRGALYVRGPSDVCSLGCSCLVCKNSGACDGRVSSLNLITSPLPHKKAMIEFARQELTPSSSSFLPTATIFNRYICWLKVGSFFLFFFFFPVKGNKTVFFV